MRNKAVSKTVMMMTKLIIIINRHMLPLIPEKRTTRCVRGLYACSSYLLLLVVKVKTERKHFIWRSITASGSAGVAQQPMKERP